MITFAILILIVAKALPVLNTHIYSIHITRITTIVFLFASALTLNSLNLESIGSGIGIYSGLFQVTSISQLIEIFLFMIGGGILIAWPQIKHIIYFPQLPKDLKIKSAPSDAKHAEKESSIGGCKSFGGVKKTLLLTDKHSTDYSLVVLFSSLGSSLLISSYDLISIYLSIELQSFGLYILSTLYRDSETSTSAGLKYFLLGGLSSCIILLGTGIIYSYTGTTNLESLYIINSIIDINQQYFIQGISLGLSLIFIGFLFKIAAAPLHNWSPDVYDGTPTIVTTWLTIIPKIAILFILLELQVKLGCEAFGLLGLKTIIVNSGYSYGLKTLLLISATLSLIIGSLLGLAQIKIKRLLAYSTISHIGFILLALAVNTEQSIDSFIFYIIQYTITNLNIFLVILGLTYCLSTNYPKDSNYSTLALGSLTSCSEGGTEATLSEQRKSSKREGELDKTTNFSTKTYYSFGQGGGNKDINFIYEFKGLFFKYPLLSISLAVSLFSMAGIPPLIGFFSKQLVLYSALQNGYYFISILAIIVSVISCSYYLQIIKLLFTPSEYAGSEGALTAVRDSALSVGLQSTEINGVERDSKGKADRGKFEILLTNTHSYLISILTFTILFFFIKPSLILNSTQLLSLSLFYI
jgi:NADH-ubiquinone oxidoreductase chain 2